MTPPGRESRSGTTCEHGPTCCRIICVMVERDRLRKALHEASEALFDACPYIDEWARRMPVRRAAERAREAARSA